jgi:hypothetical protein
MSPVEGSDLIPLQDQFTGDPYYDRTFEIVLPCLAG